MDRLNNLHRKRYFHIAKNRVDFRKIKSGKPLIFHTQDAFWEAYLNFCEQEGEKPWVCREHADSVWRVCRAANGPSQSTRAFDVLDSVHRGRLVIDKKKSGRKKKAGAINEECSDAIE